MRLVKTLSFEPKIFEKIMIKFKGDNFSKYVVELICKDLNIKVDK